MMLIRSVISTVCLVLIATCFWMVQASEPPATDASAKPLRMAQSPPLQKPSPAQVNNPVDEPDAAVSDKGNLPPGDVSPVLRLDTGGPRSYVSGLAFSPDGATLYACGWDKAVQVWNRNRNGKYEYSQG